MTTSGDRTTNYKIISYLRLPLIVGVVFIHSLALPAGNFHIYDNVFYLITNNLCGVCVPLFFFFSGYLFFINIDKFNLATYCNKLKRRFRSLLIPYIFWNLFVIAIIAYGQMTIPKLFSGAFPLVSEMTLSDWLSIFYGAFGGNEPIAFQLWFLRDLIIMVVLTPLFYFLFKVFRGWWLILPLGAYILCVPGVKTLSLSFFCIGCYWGINKWSFTFWNTKMAKILLVAYVALMLLDVFCPESFFLYDNIHRIIILIGFVTIIQMCQILFNQEIGKSKKAIIKKLSQSSFFIYCYHGIFALFLRKIIVTLGWAKNDLTAIFWYFAIVFIIVILGACLYYFLQKATPKFLSLICGGR